MKTCIHSALRGKDWTSLPYGIELDKKCNLDFFFKCKDCGNPHRNNLIIIISAQDQRGTPLVFFLKKCSKEKEQSQLKNLSENMRC